MAEDLNSVFIVGRLTRDAELIYTNSGFAICKFSIASNTSRKVGDNWEDKANFFEMALLGKRGESLNQYLTKGQQVGIQGKLDQERWEQDGAKRSKVKITVDKIQLIGSKKQDGPAESKPSEKMDYSGYTPPKEAVNDRFEDDIPF